MNWNKVKSIVLSQVCVVVFAALLAVLDVTAYWVVRWFLEVSLGLGGLWDGIFLMSTIYLCSVFGWILLANLWLLLKNMKRGTVFVDENVRVLRTSSWCCVGVFLVCMASACYYIPFAIIALAAGFMALIVRIVKNVFQQAISMQSDLDLTI